MTCATPPATCTCALAVVEARDDPRHPAVLRDRADDAAGGSWNASIVSEIVSWAIPRCARTARHLYQQASQAGDYPRVVLGVAVMSLFVSACNRLLWRPLYSSAERLAGTEKD